MRCFYCKFENNKNDRYCKKCGMPLHDEKFLRCYNCGAKIKPDYIYCPDCGINLDFKKKCPECGSIININDRFCKNCGNEMYYEEEYPSTNENLDLDKEVDQYLNESDKYIDENDYEKAIDVLNKGVSILINEDLDKKEDIRLVNLYVKRAKVYKLMGKKDRAKDNFKRALIYAKTIFADNKIKEIEEELEQL